jgi:hypothetical protein
LEHPIVLELNRYGYPKEMMFTEKVVSQKECCGIDVFGDELLEGDEIVIDKQNFDELIWKENLKRYLEERCDFTFITLPIGEVVLDQFNLKVFAACDLEKVLTEDYGFEFTTAN